MTEDESGTPPRPSGAIPRPTGAIPRPSGAPQRPPGGPPRPPGATEPDRATEHDRADTEDQLMRDIIAPLASLPEDPVAIAAEVDFPLALRGYDRIAVDAYVKKTQQLVAGLQATRSPQGAVRRALERVGEQITGILQRAHESAELIGAQSHAEAEDRLNASRVEAAQITAAAERRREELDLDADRIWAERRRIMTDVRRLAQELEATASAAAERFPPEEPTAERFAPEEPAAERPAAEQPAAEEPAAERFAPEEPAAEPPTVSLPTASPGSPGMRLIDLVHVGRERVIGCWQVGDVLVDPGPASCLPTLLQAIGDLRPRALLLTHIHLDHAGVAGSLARLWPELEVYVHERGAAHLADPSRLVESARRLYGEDMDRLWGEVLPVPESQLRILHGGETLEGDFDVVYTPGHASHHVSYRHGGTAFVGDVAGVRIADSALTIPPTPPPDIDLDAWHASLQRVAAWSPARLAMTHFGCSEDVQAQLAEVSERLDAWAELARTHDLEGFVAAVEQEIERGVGAELAATYAQAAPAEQLYAGLERYWSKRPEDGGAVPPDGDGEDAVQ